MSDFVTLQIPCDICGASISQTIRAGENGESAQVLYGKMPEHLFWHETLDSK